MARIQELGIGCYVIRAIIGQGRRATKIQRRVVEIGATDRGVVSEDAIIKRSSRRTAAGTERVIGGEGAVVFRAPGEAAPPAPRRIARQPAIDEHAPLGAPP